MVNPKLAEKTIEEFVKKFGSVGVKNLRGKTGFKKAIINSILHENRHYMKIEQSPLSFRNKKVIWKWSDTKVPLPSKNRVMSAPTPPEENLEKT
jgi:TfoX/Sxy family transcriptional regulator of competence genes